MVDQNKVILMSKIALYEKKYKKRDQRIINYFVEDYVYVNNFITRCGISLITLFFIAVGAFRIVYNGIIFPTSIEEFIDVYLSAYIGPWIGAIVVYTIISSVVFGARYKKVSKRYSQYRRLIRQLDRYEQEHQAVNKEGAADEI